MVEQDAASSPARLAQLKRDLRDMTTVLAWSPASGRPGRFLKPKSAQASLRLAAAQQLAESAGLPQLREFVMGSHLVLYAHSDTEVVLLSLKHHRQLTYITIQ
jgi:predicted deacetylase